jgi:large subunit ribosomal protein L21
MFAVMKTGGKQYKVAPNDVLVIEKLAAEAGETVQFNEVLMLGGDDGAIGDPLIHGAAVQAEVLEQKRGPKVLNLKRRRRKHGSRRLKGHRQYLTAVRITDILASGAEATGVKAATGRAAGPTAAGSAPAEQASEQA